MKWVGLETPKCVTVHQRVNCVECKLLHCEYRASKGVDYKSMPLQCIVVQHVPNLRIGDFGIK